MSDETNTIQDPGAAGVGPSAPTPTAPATTLAPETPAAEVPADKPKKGAKATGPITVKHRDHEGKVVERTFSKEVHGDDFAAVAEEFKTANADKIVPDDTQAA